jgi:hypothetical protein
MYYECAVEALPTPPSNLQIPISSHLEMGQRGTMQETGQNKRGERRGENFSYQDNGEKT